MDTSDNYHHLGWMGNRYDCFINFFDTAVDLDPTETDCCAWTKLTPTDAFKIPRGQYCGVDAKTFKGFPEKGECCEEGMKIDCDHKYFSTGPAWEDYLDFSRDEVLWIKYFTKAWHMATENGMKNLKWLDPYAGPEYLIKSKEE